MRVLPVLLAAFALAVPPGALAALPTDPFDAPKYGVKAEVPKDWPIAVREKDEYIFVAKIPTADPDRPGVALCELGLAPETLDEYRTRIDGNARRGQPGKLVRNEVVRAPGGERLETVREFRPPFGGLWREFSVRKVANRQMYTFTLNVDDDSYAEAKEAFDALIASAVLSPPNTGADRAGKAGEEGPNRWVQREFKFAIDLPEEWSPALAPSEVALFYANGPSHGIWADNVLVLGAPHQPLDLEALARGLPDQLRDEEPGCEVLGCKVIKQGKADALETTVRTRRGPFSMTVLERRFRGSRFNYEVKFTVESKRFDELLPAMRKSLDSFEEVPGEVPATGRAS
jgi:hypothetical protein